MTPMHAECVLARKLNTFLPLSLPEMARLADLQSSPVKVHRGQHLVQEGQTGHAAYVVHSGWGCTYKMLPGARRQIISFPVAGDCIGLHSFLLKTADCSFSAITDAVVTEVDSSRIMQTFTEFPRLGEAILWAMSRDENMIVDRLVSVGRRSAIERIAQFFLTLLERLKMVGLAKGREFSCPLSQFLLADILGLTSIHVNRVLRELREAVVLTFRGGKVVIHDLISLRRCAGFQL